MIFDFIKQTYKNHNKYKISSNVSVSLKALNLLEEAQVMTRGTGTVTDYSYSGRKFFLSAKVSF
jgi:hypothetical protein